MKTRDFEAIGKWIAVTACIVVAGVLVFHGKGKEASGFVWGAIALVCLV